MLGRGLLSPWGAGGCALRGARAAPSPFSGGKLLLSHTPSSLGSFFFDWQRERDPSAFSNCPLIWLISGWIQGVLGAWMCFGFPPAARPRPQSVLTVCVWCRGWAAKRFPGLQALGCSFPSPAKCWQPSRLRGQAKKRRGGIGLRRLLPKKSRAGASLCLLQRKSYSCSSSLPTKARCWSSP